MLRQTTILLTAFLTLPACLLAEEPTDQSAILSPAEEELVTLIDVFDIELNDYWSLTREIEDPEKQKSFAKENDPAIYHLPKLLEFETKYRGQDVGIDAFRKIITYAGRGGQADSPAVIARREVLKRLSTYEDRLTLPRLLIAITRGRYDPLVLDYLRTVGKSQTAHPTVSAAGRYVLAKSLLNLRGSRTIYEGYLQQITDGVEPTTPNAEERIRGMLNALPSVDEINLGCKEATELLEELAESGELYQLPEIRNKDPKWRIREIDTESTKPARYLSKVAAARLFNERHLRVGREAPSLELELADGELWSSEATRGRVVVIQFSFTGCGPCERMYPVLHELHEAYPEQASILTIMRDETDEHIHNAIKSGKMTWNIALDGSPGKIASAWAVDGFPTVYVIDRQGKIAAVGLRGDSLRAKVAELVAVEG